MMEFTLAHLPLSSIDTDDSGFRISGAEEPPSALALSMAASGLSVPILAARDGQGRFIVVSGFRRLSAAVSLGWGEICCRIADKEVPEVGLARAAVIENAFQRELGPGELVRAAALMGRYMGIEHLAESSKSIFNRRLNTGYLRQLIAIHSLPDPAATLLDHGDLSVKAARLLTEIDRAGAGAFLKVFSRYQLSASKQTEIITWTREIAARDRIEIPRVLDRAILQVSDTAQKADDKGHKDRAAAGNKIRAALYQQRFPALDAAKKAASDRLNALKLPRGIRVSLPENFEGTVYSVSATFETPREFTDRAAALKDLADTPAMSTLLDR